MHAMSIPAVSVELSETAWILHVDRHTVPHPVQTACLATATPLFAWTLKLYSCHYLYLEGNAD